MSHWAPGCCDSISHDFLDIYKPGDFYSQHFKYIFQITPTYFYLKQDYVEMLA